MIQPDYSYNYERQIEIPLLKDYCLRQKAKGLKRVFEIGGAEALNLGWLLANDFEVTVLDPCQWPDNQTWPKYVNNPKFKIIKQGIEDFVVTKEHADFALLISVLEHLGRGGYRAKQFAEPEVTCFKNIQVPFCFTTPVGQDYFYGNPPDRNYSEGNLLNYLDDAKKIGCFIEYYKAPDWKHVYWTDVQNCKYGEIMGNGASAIGYYEIE